ncbi:unnamed protein product [Symbiodinium sp. CCMP2592]|nr:unnamed protein product [Symbiodinium sp. CCMP2592]
MRNQWVRIDDPMHDKLVNWETKALKAVEDAKDALVALSSREGVSSVAMVAGPHNGEFYGLPEVYDLEMDRHTEDLKKRGIRIVDPQALILATERYDSFHMEATHENVKMTTMWYFHLASAIMLERWLVKHAMELKANSRGILFHNHFHLGFGLEELDIPPTTDLLIPAAAEMVTFPPEAPPVQRYPEEEIVLNQPILSLEKIDEIEGVAPIDFVGEIMRESEDITVEDQEHITVETVDPGSVEEKAVLERIAVVDQVMTSEEAASVAEELGIAPYEFVEPNVNATSVVDGEAASTVATSDIPTEVWNSGPMNIDYGRMGYFRLNEMECVSLGKKLSFHLRGHAKEKGFKTCEFDEEQAAEIGDVLKVIGKQWSRLTVMTIIDLLTSRHCDKGRFELQAEASDEDTRLGNFTRIRAFQGHNACLLVLDGNPKKTTVKQWALDHWVPSYTVMPLTGPYPYRATSFDLMPKLGYHATYWRNFSKIVNAGLIPGGKMTSKGNSGRAIMYAYDRTTQEMIWANRAYEPARKRLALACKDKSVATPIYGERERGHQGLVDANGYCYNYIVAGLGAMNFDSGRDAAMACNDVYDLDFYPMHAVGLEVSIPEGHALHNIGSLYQMVVHVAPRHPHRKCRSEADWRRQENISIPPFGCPSCGNSNIDGPLRMAEPRELPKGEPMDYRTLQPRGFVNANRATGHKKDRSAGSGPAAIRQQAAKYLGKALKDGVRPVMERRSRDPFQSYNNARFGISINGLDLTLTNHCYAAFVDRFYKLDEAALLAFAVHRNDCTLEILGFSGRVLKPAGPAVQILARIVGFFQDEVHYAVERGESVPELVIPQGEELRIPEGLATLGDRQLNELLVNNKFARVMPSGGNVNERLDLPQEAHQLHIVLVRYLPSLVLVHVSHPQLLRQQGCGQLSRIIRRPGGMCQLHLLRDPIVRPSLLLRRHMDTSQLRKLATMLFCGRDLRRAATERFLGGWKRAQSRASAIQTTFSS